MAGIHPNSLSLWDPLPKSETILKLLFHEAPDPMLLIDAETHVLLDLNLRAEELLGWTRKELAGSSVSRICAAGVSDCPTLHFEHSNALEPIENLVRHKDGSFIHVEISSSLFELNGKTTIFGIFRDISPRKQVEEELKVSEARYRDLFENAIDPIFIVDPSQRYLAVNQRAVEVFGYSREEFLSMRILDLIPPDQASRSQAEFNKLRQKGAYEKFEGRLRHKKGHWIDIEVSSSAIFKGGRYLGSRDIVRDISERKRTQSELVRLNALLREQATHDPLTMLPNRRLLKEHLGHAIENARRSGLKAGIIFIDLDDFKRVNDTFGHASGDELLRQVALRLQKELRRGDILARWGGDEFVALLENLKQDADVERKIKVLEKALSHPFTLFGKSCTVQASFGSSLFPDQAQESAQLIACADEAMYRRKSRKHA